MARPKAGEGTPARERIESAFWELLAEMSYPEITIALLAKRAGVNHNTFYYYYKNIDELAAQLVEQSIVPDLSLHIATVFMTGTFDVRATMANTEARERFGRICLLAGPNSASWIKDKMRETVMGLWSKSLGIDPADFTPEERTLFTFIFGGMLAVLGSSRPDEGLTQIASFAESDLGRGAYATVRGLLEKRAAR